MNGLRATPDGYVSIGSSNDWYSLAAIEEAVLRAQNPALNVNCPEGRSHNATHNESDEEHLPLPSTQPREDRRQQPQAKPLQTINRGKSNEQHLELPSTARRTI